jgi:predicted nucleotidyltransferase
MRREGGLRSEGVQQAVAEVRRGLERLYGLRLAGVVLFGSRARGEGRADSDVDLLVILRGPVDPNEEMRRTTALVSRVSLEHDTVISCVYASEEEYRSSGSPLLINVRREGIPA